VLGRLDALAPLANRVVVWDGELTKIELTIARVPPGALSDPARRE